MTYLERILRVLFWLPILLGGIVGFAFIEPRFRTFGIISAALLGVFVFLVLLQAAAERRAIYNSRKEAREIARDAKVASIKGNRP